MPQPALTREGCLTRQSRLRRLLDKHNLDAALLLDPGHVTYLTGYWCRAVNTRGVLITADKITLFAPTPCEPDPIADAVVEFDWHKLCTIVDHPPRALAVAAQPHLAGVKRIGMDVAPRLDLIDSVTIVDLYDDLLALRRTKDADEVDLLRHAIAGATAAYATARSLVHDPFADLTEVDLYAAMQAAAVRACGEPIGEFGNDFQSGSPGGPPRPRKLVKGELIPLDIGVAYRGYHSDQSRTYCVGGEPTEPQRDAHQRVIAALDFVENTVKPGVSCKQLYADVFDMLDGYNGWKFFHHLGHGIGLYCHEAPRLNPNWDDTFQAGDVITAEPGLYGDDLNAGIRIEHDYLVTPAGVERLSTADVKL